MESGVWLSRDPAGFVDGPNVYAYVKQNPWTAFDPDGLATKSELHKQRRALIQRRDAEKAAREKNGETQTVLDINAQGDGTMKRTEFGEVMNTFNTAIDALKSRIDEIDRAVDVHNGALDAMGALTGGKHSSFRLSRVQFDDEDPKNQVFLRNGNRARDLRNDVALTLLGAGAGRLISVGGKAMRLLSPAAKMAGSGPARGFIEVSESYSSVNAVKNYQGKGTDLIFDTQTNRFVIGNNPAGHSGIAEVMGVTESQQGRLVGGTIYRENGVLMTNEHSGHFGHLLNDGNRAQFQQFMNNKGVDSTHSATWGR